MECFNNGSVNSYLKLSFDLFLLKYAWIIFAFLCKMADSLPLHHLCLKKIPTKRMKLADNILNENAEIKKKIAERESHVHSAIFFLISAF